LGEARHPPDVEEFYGILKGHLEELRLWDKVVKSYPEGNLTPYRVATQVLDRCYEWDIDPHTLDWRQIASEMQFHTTVGSLLSALAEKGLIPPPRLTAEEAEAAYLTDIERRLTELAQELEALPERERRRLSSLVARAAGLSDEVERLRREAEKARELRRKVERLRREAEKARELREEVERLRRKVERLRREAERARAAPPPPPPPPPERPRAVLEELRGAFLAALRERGVERPEELLEEAAHDLEALARAVEEGRLAPEEARRRAAALAASMAVPAAPPAAPPPAPAAAPAFRLVSVEQLPAEEKAYILLYGVMVWLDKRGGKYGVGVPDYYPVYRSAVEWLRKCGEGLAPSTFFAWHARTLLLEEAARIADEGVWSAVQRRASMILKSFGEAWRKAYGVDPRLTVFVFTDRKAWEESGGVLAYYATAYWVFRACGIPESLIPGRFRTGYEALTAWHRAGMPAAFTVRVREEEGGEVG